ncbi:MAG: Clp protease [Clostridia bacterium]|nr:Clp protease [Clostridia bacterium]
MASEEKKSHNEDENNSSDPQELIREYGQAVVKNKNEQLYILSITGEIEGHEVLSSSTKSTKYEHVLPQLAKIEHDETIDGVLILLNTVGGDVEAGLAIAEMIASLSKPTVSLVLGGSHSIGVPVAVSADYSYVVPTGTMVIHPVRTSGTVLGVKQSFDYMKQIQERIVSFVVSNCSIKKNRMEELMMNTSMLTRDIGTILVGKEIVKEGIIDDVGGIQDAVAKLKEMIKENH